MSQPIDDSYIDSVIKDNQGGHPDPNRTSGQDLRELIRRIRDGLEENINYKLAGGANAIKIVCWDEFIMSTKIKIDKYGRPLNSFYDYNILGKDIKDCRTDAVYTVKNYLSKISQIETYILQPIWYMTVTGSTQVDTTKIYPALGSVSVNLDEKLNNDGTLPRDVQWSVNGQIAFSTDPNKQAVKFDGTSLLGGTPSDDGFVEFARFVSGLGIRVGVDPWFIGINRDPVTAGQVAHEQTWRGYLSPDAGAQYHITDFDAFCASYTSFMHYYVDLMRNNSIDLGIYYIGSEYAAISTTASEAYRRKWITTLIRIAKYTKEAFPDCITVYAANWQGELNTGYDRFTLDELWASPYVDRFGCDYYPGITEDITNDAGDIASGLVSGEASDFVYITSGTATDPTSYAYQGKLSTSGKKGKTGLPTSLVSGNIGDKNIAGFLNKHHFNSSKQYDQLAVPAKETLLTGEDLTKAFTSVGIVQTNGNQPFPVYNYYPLLYGRFNMEIADAPDDKLCYLALNSQSGIKINYQHNFPDELTEMNLHLLFDIGDSLLPGRPPAAEAVIAALAGRFKLYFDTTDSVLKLLWYQTNGSTKMLNSTFNFQSNATYDVRFGWDGAVIYIDLTVDTGSGPAAHRSFMSPDIDQSFWTCWSRSSTSAANTVYVLQDESGNFLKVNNLYKLTLQDENFGFAWYFEEQYALGTRTAYMPKKGMITEFGIAAIGGSAVQSNAFPFATATFHSDSQNVDFSDTGVNKDIGNLRYWRSLANNNVFVKEVYGPYGSNFQSDELEQAIGNSVVNDYLEGHGFDIRCLYCADLRPPENFKFSLNGQLYFIDSPGYGLGHSITGKLSNGVGKGDILERMRTEDLPPLIGMVIDSTIDETLPGKPGQGKALLANFNLTGTNTGNTARGSEPTLVEPVLQQENDGILFEYPGVLKFKPEVNESPFDYELPNGQFASGGTIYYTTAGITYKVPVKAVCLESKKYVKTNWSQYTMSAVISVKPGTITPHQVGIGISGKNIPYYISTSYLVVDFATGKLLLKTRRGSASLGNSVTVYQLNGDDDVISHDNFTSLDYTKDFYFSYKRNRFYYTWSVTHNNQTITMNQPENWQGGGKMGTMGIVNFGGSYLVKDFKVTYDVAKDLDWYIAGASITEGNEADVWRAVPQYRCAFNAEGGNREFEFVAGGQDDLENIGSCKYASWDLAVNGLNYVKNNFGTATDYNYDDLLNYNTEVINKILSLPGLRKLFLVLLTPNIALIPGVREMNAWALKKFGPDSAYHDRVVFIDAYKPLNWPDPAQPASGISNDNDNQLPNPSGINMDIFGGMGYLYGYSADGLHPSASVGYRTKTEVQLAIMRPYIDAERNGTGPYVAPVQLAAPELTFVAGTGQVQISWARQVSLPAGVPVTYKVTSNDYANEIYSGPGNSFLHTGLDMLPTNHTYSIMATAPGYLNSPSNNYLVKTV